MGGGGLRWGRSVDWTGEQGRRWRGRGRGRSAAEKERKSGAAVAAGGDISGKAPAVAKEEGASSGGGE